MPAIRYRTFCAMPRRHLQSSRPMDLALPGIMRHGASIKLKGVLVDGQIKSFSLQLVTPEGIALYIHVPINGEISLNSFRSGQWEREERHYNPIRQGRYFHLKIKHKNDFMLIKVNGHQICNFFHREMPNKIRTFAIRGDIHIEDVHFKKFKHQQRDGPAVVVHSNLPPPPIVQQVVYPSPQQVVYPPPQQVVIQSMPQTYIQQETTTIYPPIQTAPPSHPLQHSIIAQAATTAITDGPPPYPAEEYPTLPVKM